MQALLDAQPDAIFSSLFGPDLARFVREGQLRGLFKDRPVFNLLGGEPEYLDPLKDEAPVGLVRHGLPVVRDRHAGAQEFLATRTRRASTTIRAWARWSATAPSSRRRRRIRKAGSTDPEKIVAALSGLTLRHRRSATSRSAPIDHQSTMGAYVGRTAVKDGKGVMVDWRYADGKDYLPTDAVVRALRPQ